MVLYLTLTLLYYDPPANIVHIEVLTFIESRTIKLRHFLHVSSYSRLHTTTLDKLGSWSRKYVRRIDDISTLYTLRANILRMNRFKSRYFPWWRRTHNVYWPSTVTTLWRACKRCASWLSHLRSYFLYQYIKKNIF